MKHHDPILFLKNPKIWIKDKLATGLSQKQISYIAIVPNIFILIGFIADLNHIYNISSTAITILLVCFLFVYGLINLWLILWVQRAGIRLERDRKTFNILHKNVIESFREYFFDRTYSFKKGTPLTQHDISNHISIIIEKFNENFMKKHYHRGKITVTLKYLKNETLIPIRKGDNFDHRSFEPELLCNSFVYLSLSETGRKPNYIYVKNLKNPDKYECEVLGHYLEKVQARALNKYSTFIAIPIRAGKMPLKSTEFITRPDLGILGFDSEEEYLFGNFDTHELDIIACLTDLLSEPVQDLINTTN